MNLEFWETKDRIYQKLCLIIDKKKTRLETVFTKIKHAGINLVFKSNIHQKFAIIDNKISWYGSINLLSFGYSEESVMRLESTSIAHELAESINLSSCKSH